MISLERLAELTRMAPAFERSLYPIREAELRELLDTYARAHHLDGSGPARGTLEHRIEELEGTVGELTKARSFRASVAHLDVCARCGEHAREHVQNAAGTVPGLCP